MTNEAQESLPYVNLVREAFLYQNLFRGKLVVFKIEFPVTESETFPFLMKDIALLVKTGVKVVIVPGSQEYIDEVLAEHGRKSEFIGGERRTTKAIIPYVEMAAYHAASRFMTGLSAAKADALIGNFVRSRSRGVVNGIDMEFTGTVDKIFSRAINKVLDLGMVPVIPCIGRSPTGKAYNVSSSEIAVSLCRALDPVKLVIVSAGCDLKTPELRIPPEGVITQSDGRLLHLSPECAETVLNINFRDGCTLPDGAAIFSILTLAVEAAKTGIERVHIVNGFEDGVILKEFFSNLGAGTMIYADEYKSVRSIHNSDIPDMLRIMEPLMKKGILLRRTAEDIQKNKDDYVVFLIDGAVQGCASLHDWGESQAEIGALATNSEYAEMGIGRSLVEYLIDRARERGFKSVFVLTVNAVDWFEGLGFTEATLETLPPMKQQRYNKKRASKIFRLSL